MEKAHQIISSKVVGDLKAEFGDELVGVMVGGSAAAGGFSENSDLDLVALIRSLRRQRRVFKLQGVTVELLIRPSPGFEEQFKETNVPEMLGIFAKGEVIFDSDKRMKQLKGLAVSIWQKGRPNQNLEYPFLQKMRHVPYDLLDDAHDLLKQDLAAAHYTMQHALQMAIDVHFRMAKLWGCKPKHTLQELRRHSPQIAAKIGSFLSPETKIEEKFTLLSSLLDEILTPLGGRLGEWSSPWEKLDPNGRWQIEK